VSRNRFCDFLADPDSRSFSRFGAIILQFAVFAQRCFAKTGSGRQTQEEVDPKQPGHYVVAPRVEATALSRCPACQLQPPRRTHTHTPRHTQAGTCNTGTCHTATTHQHHHHHHQHHHHHHHHQHRHHCHYHQQCATLAVCHSNSM
jgi:hypothetical protein